MKFKKLTRIVFVCRTRFARGIVEVILHGGAFCYIFKEHAEIAKTVFANHVTIVSWKCYCYLRVAIRVYVEVIMPKLNHNLPKLPFAVHRFYPLNSSDFFKWTIPL